MEETGNNNSFLRRFSEAHLQCSLCQDWYKQPKTLICLHSFCEECLSQHEKPHKQTIECPECEKVTFIARGGVRGLATDQKLVGMVAMVRHEAGQVVPTCASAGHAGKRRCVFCETCAGLICLACLTESHGDHDVEEVSHSLVAVKRHLVQEQVPKYEKSLADTAEALETAGRLQREFDAALQRSRREIEDQVDEEIARVTAAKHRIMDELSQIQTEREKLLTGYTQDLASRRDRLRHFLQNSRTAHRTYGDYDFLLMYPKLYPGFGYLADFRLPRVDPNVSALEFKPNNTAGDISLGRILTADIIKTVREPEAKVR